MQVQAVQAGVRKLALWGETLEVLGGAIASLLEKKTHLGVGFAILCNFSKLHAICTRLSAAALCTFCHSCVPYS